LSGLQVHAQNTSGPTWDGVGLWNLNNVNNSTLTFPSNTIARFTNFQYAWPPAVSIVSKQNWTVQSRLVLLERVRAWNFTNVNGGFAWQTALDWGSGSAIMGYGRDDVHTPNTGIMVGGECTETAPGSVLTASTFLSQCITLYGPTQTMYFSVYDSNGVLIGQTSSAGSCGTMFGTLPVSVAFFTQNGIADVDSISLTSGSNVALFDDFLNGKSTETSFADDFSGSQLSSQWITSNYQTSSVPATVTVGNSLLDMKSNGNYSMSDLQLAQQYQITGLANQIQLSVPFSPAADSLSLTARVMGVGRFSMSLTNSSLASIPINATGPWPWGVSEPCDSPGGPPTICPPPIVSIGLDNQCSNGAVSADYARNAGHYWTTVGVLSNCGLDPQTWYRLELVVTRNPYNATYNLMADDGSIIATASTSDMVYPYDGIQNIALTIFCGYPGCNSSVHVDWIVASSPTQSSPGGSVGGVIVPVNKIVLLAPYIGLAGGAPVLSMVFLKLAKKRKHRPKAC